MLNSITSLKKHLAGTKCFLGFIFVSTLCFGQTIHSNVNQISEKSQKYLFYLHGKIIEDNGIRPQSEKYGIYEYEQILQVFADSGFVVISEARQKNTNVMKYAQKIKGQIDSLLQRGVKSNKITIVGASKGAAIAVLVSNMLKNKDLNFVLMAICNDLIIDYWVKNDIHFWGKVLYIYDRSDTIAGSCTKHLISLKSKGLSQFKELQLNLGLGHGVLYRPMKEWITPVVKWANQKNMNLIQ